MLILDANADVTSETISETLTLMTNYALEHFKSEEDLFNLYGYPESEIHKEQHNKYWLKLTKLCQKTMAHEASVPEELLHYLVECLLNHILKSDMKYRDFFSEKGVI